MVVCSKVIENSGVAFGTSGARGLVTQFTPSVCAAFTHAFVSVIQDRFSFNRVALAIDNRPSSYSMAMSCAMALRQKGIGVEYYGVVPTPALAHAAMLEKIPAIMVTGSHIPFDRNGLKFYRPDGEISKDDEHKIMLSESTFEEFSTSNELVAKDYASKAYVKRYVSLFKKPILKGKRIGIYEHSSAGRDLYVDLFSKLGAEVIRLSRSDEFVPIDTEAVSEDDKQKARFWSKNYKLDAIFSTDGDGDRPLVADEHGEWLRGDILGLLCSQALNIEALAVPVSCNSAIELTGSFKLIKRTKIGSPYVIAEFPKLADRFRSVGGFEANGGYLLGSDIQIHGKTLTALPTRDAVLPVLMLLMEVGASNISSEVQKLPNRFTYSDRIKNFSTKQSQRIMAFGLNEPNTLTRNLGFSEEVFCVDDTDGLRLTFRNGEVIHLRPSGNAPELRCYSEASTLEEAKKIVERALERLVGTKF